MGSLIRIPAVLASVLVLLGFFAFVWDESSAGSEGQVAKIQHATQTTTPSSHQESVRERQHGPVREGIDDANDVLLAPFANLVGGNDAWVQRVVPALLALLVYGLGGTLLANMMPRRSHPTQDWRSAHT
jgi:hypothetical protein